MAIILAILGLAVSVVGPVEELDFLKSYRDQAKAFAKPYMDKVLTYGTGSNEPRAIETQRP